MRFDFELRLRFVFLAQSIISFVVLEWIPEKLLNLLLASEVVNPLKFIKEEVQNIETKLYVENRERKNKSCHIFQEPN